MTHKIVYLFITFTLIACYSLRTSGDAEHKYKKNDSPWKKISEPRTLALPSTITPGEYATIIYVPLWGKAQGMPALTANLYDADGKKISSAQCFLYKIDSAEHSVLAALVAPPSTCTSGSAVVKIEDARKSFGEVSLEIRKRNFTAEVIPLNPANTSLRTEPDPQKTAESQKLWAIISATGGDIWCETAFTTPVAAATRRSSFFGDRRVFKYSNGTSATSIHAGIDYAVPKGTPVAACGAGKAMLARPRIVTGNSVIIEHLPGVYSIYYHLETIGVSEGAMVSAGERIGLSGSTGLSTGPHLHWEIRVATENADPDAFCARAPLDRMAILRCIFEGG